jgi:hypothetical protein
VDIVTAAPERNGQTTRRINDAPRLEAMAAQPADGVAHNGDRIDPLPDDGP